MQALYLLALEPLAETTADVVSYGFRKKRCTQDAIEQCFTDLAKEKSPQWVLEGDIKGCFDHISHQWLIQNIPMDKRSWANGSNVVSYSSNNCSPPMKEPRRVESYLRCWLI